MRRLMGGVVVAAAAMLAPQTVTAQIKIGFIATMSGPVGGIGQDMYDAFMLGIEHSGGKLGGQAVEVLKEDDQLKPDVGTQIVQRLIEKDRVPIIAGVGFANIMMAIYRQTVDAKVFLIGTLTGPSPIAGKMCSPFFFSTSWQTDQLFEPSGFFANSHFKRMVLMAPNYQAGKDAIAGFKRYYKGEVVGEVYTQLNQADYAAEIAQLQAKNPDAIFVFYPGGMGVNFVKQYRQAGLLGKLPILSGSTVEGTNLPALGDIALGVSSSAQWGPDFTNEASLKFVQGFEAKYGRIPSNFAAQSYDAALLLDSAIRKVNGDLSDKEAFQKALKAGDFKSTRGNFKYNHNNFPIQDFYLFTVAKDAKGRVSLKTSEKVFTDHADAYNRDCPM
jgi:branched-chain amino acid transport system substrate-binding protein